MGTDFHGQNVTKAAVKAVKDAISHSCLCGLSEVLALKDLDRDIKITVTVAVSRPEEVNPETVAACLPKGGSMHIADRDKGILGANGIVGAGHNIAVGAGLSASYRGTDQVCVCFFGDASTNQGTFHESLNMAAIWKLPIIFVCENNNYGISMSQARHQAIKDVADRGAAYGIPGIAVDGNDVMAVNEAAAEAVARARKGQGPTLLECKTYRWRGHFEGDPANYKPKEEQEAWLKKDPIPRFTKFLKENNILTAEELAALDQQVQEEMAEAIRFAEESPSPTADAVVQDVYSDIVEEVRAR